MSLTHAVAMALALGMAPKVADKPEPPRVDFRERLFDRQQAAWDCHETHLLLCSRRAGKSILLSYRLLRAADDNPGSVCLYIAPTKVHARQILWKVLKRAAITAWGNACKISETYLSIETPRGGTVVLGGVEDEADRKRVVGSGFALAAVDECGKFPPELLRALVEDDLEPATVDFGGYLILAGVPGAYRNGYWYDLTGDVPRRQRDENYPMFGWTMFENPFLPNARDVVARIMKKRGWTETTPTYVREYLGRWADDPGSLVYPLSAHNFVPTLPKRNAQNVLLPAKSWRYVVGADVGVVHSCAFTVGACHPLDRHIYLVHSEKHQGMLTEQFRHRLRQLQQLVGTANSPIDAGGMGRAYLDDCLRHGVPCQPAEKREKEAFVRLLRDDIQGGVLKVVQQHTFGENGTTFQCSTDPFVDECAVLGWDDAKRLPDKTMVDDATDSALYTVRALYHYRDEDQKPEDEFGGKAWLTAEQKRMEERARQHARLREGRARWDK